MIDRVLSILRAEGWDVAPGTDLRSLGFDSLDLVEIGVGLEEEFGMTLDLHSAQTPQDIAMIIHEKLIEYGFSHLRRPDKRPEVYTTPAGSKLQCEMCVREGYSLAHEGLFMTSPVDTDKGHAVFLCLKHLPDDVVIFDPVSGFCRDKKSNTWRE